MGLRGTVQVSTTLGGSTCRGLWPDLLQQAHAKIQENDRIAALRSCRHHWRRGWIEGGRLVSRGDSESPPVLGGRRTATPCTLVHTMIWSLWRDEVPREERDTECPRPAAPFLRFRDVPSRALERADEVAHVPGRAQLLHDLHGVLGQAERPSLPLPDATRTTTGARS